MFAQRLGQLAREFRDQQQALDSPRSSTGSHVIGVLLSISQRVAKFADQPAAVEHCQQQVLDFKVPDRTEYLAFLLMAFLKLSI
jgi:7-keto-8-aminopelargonate synthetase-like enzyme